MNFVSPYGWCFRQDSWVYRDYSVDIWSPLHDGWCEDAIRRKHENMGKTPGGKALDAYFAHVTACEACKATEQHDESCETAVDLYGALPHMWQVWVRQLVKAGSGKAMKQMYRER